MFGSGWVGVPVTIPALVPDMRLPDLGMIRVHVGPPCGDVVPIPLIRRAGDHDVRRGRPPLIPQRTYGRVGLTPRNYVAYPPPSCGRLGSGEGVDAVGEGDPVQLGDESFGFGERP